MIVSKRLTSSYRFPDFSAVKKNLKSIYGKGYKIYEVIQVEVQAEYSSRSDGYYNSTYTNHYTIVEWDGINGKKPEQIEEEQNKKSKELLDAKLKKFFDMVSNKYK